jgi:hypothetical protein
MLGAQAFEPEKHLSFVSRPGCKGIENFHRENLKVTNIARDYDESAYPCCGCNHCVLKQVI